MFLSKATVNLNFLSVPHEYSSAGYDQYYSNHHYGDNINAYNFFATSDGSHYSGNHNGR